MDNSGFFLYLVWKITFGHKWYQLARARWPPFNRTNKC